MPPPTPSQQPKIIGDAAPHDVPFFHYFSPIPLLPPPPLTPPSVSGLHACVRITGKRKTLHFRDEAKAMQPRSHSLLLSEISHQEEAKTAVTLHTFTVCDHELHATGKKKT